MLRIAHGASGCPSRAHLVTGGPVEPMLGIAHGA